MTATLQLGDSYGLARANSQNLSAKWVVPFCAIAYLFFQGALTHVFGGDDGEGAGPLKVLFLPFALLIQLVSTILLTRDFRLKRVRHLLGRNRAMVLSLLLIILSAAWSIDPALTLRRSVALLGTTTVGLLLYIELGRPHIIRFFALNLAAFTVVSVLFSVAAPGLGTHVNDQFAGQWRGLLSFKNQAAWSATLFIVCWLSLPKVGWTRTFNYPLLLIGFLMLIKTGSATGLIATTFGIAGLWAVTAYRQMPVLRPLMLTAIVMISIAALLDFENLFAGILDLLGRDASLTGRTSIWSALWPVIEDRFWIGNGYLAFWDHAAEYFGNVSWMADIGHAHNAYIEIILDVGVIGLAVQILFITGALLSLFRLANRGDYQAAAMFVILLTFAVVGMAGALFFRANTGTWVMIVTFACYAADRQIAPTPGAEVSR